MSGPQIYWTCHVCGAKRPDEKIAVYSEERELRIGRYRVNVRYCDDRPKCEQGAPDVARRWALA